jgi:two-component sensor histidine kinase
MDAVVEEDREALQQALEKRIAGDFTDPEFPMYRIIRPEGQMAWIKARAYPIFDATGKPVRIVGVAEDVTENRMAQEGLSNSLREKNLLLKELHHRVKNNLQVISSLLGLQMKKMGDAQIEQALKDSRDRIRSMALVHEALHQTKDFARIDGLRYVRDMVANLRNSYEQISSGIRTEVLGESVQLMIEEAVPFGLLLNELVTNVYKHAFPGGRAGELRIELNREGNLVSLRVADNGVGLPPKLDLESPSTLGLQLVNMLVVQLEGELEVEREEGIAFSISFRLKEGEGKEDG